MWWEGGGVRGEAHVEFYVVVCCLHSRQYFNVLIPVAIACLAACVCVCVFAPTLRNGL